MRTPLIGGHLDTQTVTTGASGSVPNRLRGYSSFAPTGSIVDGTSNVAGNLTIDELVWDEFGGGGSQVYRLTITGASNSGFTTLTIGSTVLTRTSATFGSGIWSWVTADTVGTQSFGAASNVVPCYFD